MTFATATNGNAVAVLTGGLVQKVAELVTFPNIDGRDAPGKTGAAAKPALVTDVGVWIYPINSGVTPTVRIGMWSSTGTGFVSSDNYTPPYTSSFKKRPIPSRAVFSGTQYFVGFSIINPVLVDTNNYGVVWGHAAGANTARLDRTFYTTSTNFVDQELFGVGPIAYQLDYDVLPTAPTSPNTIISGAASTSITFTWGAVSSDGGAAVSGYRIQRSTDNINFTTIVTNSQTTDRIYIDTNLVPGVTYFYRVAAINAVAIAHGSDYSGPYSASSGLLVPGASAGNAQSILFVTVDDPEPLAASFSDFGPGIRFTDIEVQYGSENLYNEVEATTKDEFSDLQTASAPQSKVLYGVRSYSFKDLLNATDAGAFEVAKDYLTYYFKPELRVDSITVDLSNLTLQEKLQVLALEIDSYITVSFTPNGVGDPKIASGLVTGISHRITITSHEVELRLRTERNLFTLDSDSKGILNVNILGP